MTLSHPVVPRQQFHKRLQSDLKNLPKVEILKFQKCNSYNVLMSERHNFSLMLYIYPIWFVPDKKPVAGEKNRNLTFKRLKNGNF